ncbi:outer membrane beta-barrel protein [Chitinophaga lutea]
MKKMIVMAVMGLFGITAANAQVQKGNFLVGGTLGYASSSDKTDGVDGKETTSVLTLSPKVGYALSSKWMIGVSLDGSIGTVKNTVAEPETKTTTSLFAPAVFVRNYHMLGDKVAFFGEASVGYGFGSEKDDDTKVSKTNVIGASVNPGIAYFVTKRLMLEGVFGGLYYANTTVKPEAAGAPEQKTSQFGVSFTEQFKVGVSFLF